MTNPTDTQMLDWLQSKRARLQEQEAHGLCHRIWTVTTFGPERANGYMITTIVGRGQTAREAIEDAMARP